MRLIPLALTDDRTHVALEGTFDLWAQQRIGAELLRLVAGRQRPALVDLSGVDLLGSAGLEALLDVAGRLRRAGAALVLVAPRPFVRRTIAMTGLSDALPTAPDVESGLRHLGLAADAA